MLQSFCQKSRQNHPPPSLNFVPPTQNPGSAIDSSVNMRSRPITESAYEKVGLLPTRPIMKLAY